jgi:hypothetical protein
MLFLLLACPPNEAQKPDDSAPSLLIDQDGDGYLEDEDCDDADSTTHPNALELCDGIDNNCNSETDEGVRQIFYEDRDQDGYGDPNTPLEACEAPDGSISNNQDCNDSNPGISPLAQEVCDEVDNDCDNEIDEGVGTTWYADSDSDGYGNEQNTLTGCNQPAGYLGNFGDCDDTDPLVNPRASEICNNKDDDCDQDIDEFAESTWYQDADADGYGNPLVTLEACEPPEGYTADNSDCDDSNAKMLPGATEICDNLDNDCNGLVDDNAQDASLWHLDGDGDGYAGNRITQVACSQPAGYLPAPSAADTDCDDSNAAIYPSALESCNGVDDDCDGVIDDGATDFATWYADTDGDGYGDPTASTLACSPPAGYLSDNTDCDDGNSAIYPGASEHCDGVDEDCDGTVDNNPVDPTAWYQDADGDGYGDPATEVFACESPYIPTSGDCDDQNSSIHPAATDDCDGVDNDCSGYADDAGLCPCEVAWYGDHSYLLCSDFKNWEDAELECEVYGYTLATVEDAAEDAFLWTEVNAINSTYGLSLSYWWIGITDSLVEGSFGWVGGSSSYTNWNPGEPNDLYSNEDCGQLSYEGNHWNDWTCTNTTSYLCEAG